MANHPSILFDAGFTADNTSNFVSFTLAADPVGMSIPGNDASVFPQVTAVPSNVQDVTCGGLTVTSATVTLGIVTVTFSAVVPTGHYTVNGRLIF